MRITYIIVLLLMGGIVFEVLTQQQSDFQPSTFSNAEAAQPFIELEAEGIVHDDLYQIEKTGVSTVLLVETVQAFIVPLNQAQLQTILSLIDDSEGQNFAWLDTIDVSAIFYYSIPSSIVLIEMDYQDFTAPLGVQEIPTYGPI